MKTKILLITITIFLFPLILAAESYGSGSYGSGAFGKAVCGDNVCDLSESCSTCSVDCGTCPTESSGSSGGGGGSSGPGSPTATKSSLLVDVKPGESTTITTFEGTGIKEISIIINKQLQNIRIQVYKYDSKPTEVSKEISGKIYRYLQIETENLNENLNTATVEFEVENSWLEDNGLKTDEVSIYKFDNQTETWNELETTYEREENETNIYSIEINSFSFFAVAEKSKPSLVEEIVDAVAESYENASKTKYGLIIWWSIFSILLLGIVTVLIFLLREARKDKPLLIEKENVEQKEIFNNEFN